jgi:hypothetical protein
MQGVTGVQTFRQTEFAGSPYPQPLSSDYRGEGSGFFQISRHFIGFTTCLGTNNRRPRVAITRLLQDFFNDSSLLNSSQFLFQSLLFDEHFFVIHTEQMQNRGVPIGNADSVFNGGET